MVDELNAEHNNMSADDLIYWLDQTGASVKVDCDSGETGNSDMAEGDMHGFTPYLEQSNTARAEAEPNADTAADANRQKGESCDRDWTNLDRPVADGLNNTYVQVVYTNGIHHLAIVTCLCQGENNIPLDQMAAQLLSASFT